MGKPANYKNVIVCMRAMQTETCRSNGNRKYFSAFNTRNTRKRLGDKLAFQAHSHIILLSGILNYMHAARLEILDLPVSNPFRFLTQSVGNWGRSRRDEAVTDNLTIPIIFFFQHLLI